MNKLIAKQPIAVANIERYVSFLELHGRFNVPLTETERREPKRYCALTYGLERCLRWVWLKWITGVKGDSVLSTLNAVLEKSLKLMSDELSLPAEAKALYQRALHDLLCFHLAALAGNRDLLAKLAEVSTYAGDNKTEDACEEAWAGLWKYSSLGDRARAEQQKVIMFSSPKPMNLRLPRRQVVEPWLSEDWKQFVRALQSAYKQRWTTYQKYGDLIYEDGPEVLVALDKINGRTIAHWQENAFAIQAWTRGVDIPFDPLFLPSISVAGLVREGQPIAVREPLI